MAHGRLIHFSGHILRVCHHHNGDFRALTLDAETCDVAVERRCDAPVYDAEGRSYRNAHDRPVVAPLVLDR